MNKKLKEQMRAARTHEVRRAAEEMGMEAQEGRDLLPYLAYKEGLAEWAATDTLLRRGKASVPALLSGLTSNHGKIRSTCALLLDHVADDRCIEPLKHALYNDPLESVRRCALHSLVCDGCKACPLATDVVAVLMQVAGNDRSMAVRRRAVFYLSMQSPDTRILPFLESLFLKSTDSVLLRRAENAMRQQLMQLGSSSFGNSSASPHGVRGFRRHVTDSSPNGR